MGLFNENSATTESSWTGDWLTWNHQSDEMLRNLETRILSCLKTAYKRFYVDIGPVVGQSDRIWTMSMNEESEKTPLVMLHGMGAGLALWCANLDALAATRPVYAIDLLGFGRSSRPRFASDALKAEAQWVESVEEWRRELNLAQFVLLGHSLGGYIATAYAIKYPERVRHLIVADPWGYNVRNAEDDARFARKPLWMRALFSSVNPMWVMRAAGPAGRWLITRTQAESSRKYAKYLEDAETLIPEYIYRCNVQTPSGETAFCSLGELFLFAKSPMLPRLHRLHAALPLTDIYGGRSWVPRASHLVREQRPTSRLYSKIIEDASHNLYLDNPEVFNETVIEACARADEYDPQIPPRETPGEAGDSSVVEHMVCEEVEQAGPQPAIGLMSQHGQAMAVQ